MQITLDFIWVNPNPPHVYDCTDAELERLLEAFGSRTLGNTLPITPDRKYGFVAQDFIHGLLGVKVKSREVGDDGKPLTLWERLRYLLKRRYRY
ncbi:hypothetical protein KW797_00015 [Candidatus Parcubacteria bacterium]|nr:hypothetical protein [Candidatus Parcubacteria bacterium]